jgi:hypothetical protein
MNHIKIKEIIKIYVPEVLSIIIFFQSVKGVSGKRCFMRFLNLLVIPEALLIDGSLLNFFFKVCHPLLCWFNNKEFCLLHIQLNTTVFHPVVQ